MVPHVVKVFPFTSQLSLIEILALIFFTAFPFFIAVAGMRKEGSLRPRAGHGECHESLDGGVSCAHES